MGATSIQLSARHPHSLSVCDTPRNVASGFHFNIATAHGRDSHTDGAIAKDWEREIRLGSEVGSRRPGSEHWEVWLKTLFWLNFGETNNL